MIYHFAPTFDRSFRRLPLNRRQHVHQNVNRLIDLLNVNKGQLPVGFGLKRLREIWWEFRVGLSDRVVFTLEGNSVTFVLAGTHDEVHRFLKHR